MGKSEDRPSRQSSVDSHTSATTPDGVVPPEDGGTCWAAKLRSEKVTFGFAWKDERSANALMRVLLRARKEGMKLEIRVENSLLIVVNIILFLLIPLSLILYYLLRYPGAIELGGLVAETQAFLDSQIKSLRNALFDRKLRLGNTERLTAYLAMEVVMGLLGQWLSRVAISWIPDSSNRSYAREGGSRGGLLRSISIFLLQVTLLVIFLILTIVYLFPLPDPVIAKVLWWLVILIVGFATVLSPISRIYSSSKLTRPAVRQQLLYYRRRLAGLDDELAEIGQPCYLNDFRLSFPPIPRFSALLATCVACVAVFAIAASSFIVYRVACDFAAGAFYEPFRLSSSASALGAYCFPFELLLLRNLRMKSFWDSMMCWICLSFFFAVRVIVFLVLESSWVELYGWFHAISYVIPLMVLSYLPLLVGAQIFNEGLADHRIVGLVREHRRLQAAATLGASLLNEGAQGDSRRHR